MTSQPAITSERAATAVVLAFGWTIGVVAHLSSGTWWLVDAARSLLSTHRTTFTVDPMSPLPLDDRGWTVAGWLPALLLHGSYRVGNVWLLSTVAGALGAILMLALYRSARIESRQLPSVAATMMTAVLMIPMLLEAQTFALVIGATVVLLLMSGRWWWVPPLIALWANVHGSVPLGIAICAAAAFGLAGTAIPPQLRRMRARTTWLIVCAAASFVNPLGPWLYVYVHDVSSTPHLYRVTDRWSHLDLWSGYGIYCLLLLGVALSAMTESRLRRRAIMLVAVFAALTFYWERNIVWLAILIVPHVARSLDESIWRTSGWPTVIEGRVRWPTLVACIAIFAVFVPGGAPQRSIALDNLPPRTMLDSIPTGARVVSHADVADYIRLTRGVQVYVDARFERYRAADLKRYVAAMQGDDNQVRRLIDCANSPERRFDTLVAQRSHQRWQRLVERLAQRESNVHAVARDRQWIVAVVTCP